jgi:hypothetical protein
VYRSFITALALSLFSAINVQGEDHPIAKKTAKDSARQKCPTHDTAVAILRKVDKATKAVKAVRYEGRFSASGVGGKQMPTATGTAAFAGGLEDGFETYRFDVHLSWNNEVQGRHLTTGGNGQRFYLLDWDKKLAYENTDEQVIGSDGQKSKWFLTVIEFIHPTPFTHEIEAKRVELKDSAQVGDVDCDVIHVVYGVNGQEATWFFGKADHLPRRVIRSFPIGIGRRAVRDYTITNLEVDPEFAEDEFVLNLPEGFKKTDQFAPTFGLPR